jgi:AP-3 complex subunit mu
VPEQYPQLTGTILLQANSNQTATKTEAPTVELNWKVPMGTISGLSVSSLLLTNETYKPYKGVRAMARSGKYQVRTL